MVYSGTSGSSQKFNVDHSLAIQDFILENISLESILEEELLLFCRNVAIHLCIFEKNVCRIWLSCEMFVLCATFFSCEFCAPSSEK